MFQSPLYYYYYYYYYYYCCFVIGFAFLSWHFNKRDLNWNELLYLEATQRRFCSD
jgi:hypothetical protein